MKQLSFLEEPIYTPRWPEPHTLAMKALKILLEGDTLTHPQFEALTRSWRLSAHIHILKKLGWPVHKEVFEQTEKPDYGIDRHHAVYYLAQDCIAMVRGV